MTAPDHMHDPLDLAPRSWRSWLAPAVMVLITLAGIAAVFWGRFNPTSISVRDFDAGPVAEYAIGDVRPFEEVDIFVVGLEDGRLRAIDARVASSGCVVELRQEDGRGASGNPLGRPGTLVDPCTGAAWFLDGDQLDAAGAELEPLRTFVVSYKTPVGGQQRVYVEVIGRN